ncbi:MAG: ankyrin repeat domain-containing protein [Gammaproteobacteria bacterium]
MTNLRKESKATASLTTLPSDVMENMVHMLWSHEQRALAKTAKEPSIWVAKGLLYELIELLELKMEEMVMPTSLQEAKKMYMELLRKHPTYMFCFLSNVMYSISRWEAGVLEDRYIKHLFHLCSADKKSGGYMVYQLINKLQSDADMYRLANQFITHGADVNWRDRDGNTLLLAIIRSGSKTPERLETVKTLLKNGADITATGKDGKSALELSRLKDKEVHNLLMEHLVQRRVGSMALQR